MSILGFLLRRHLRLDARCTVSLALGVDDLEEFLDRFGDALLGGAGEAKRR